MNTVRKTIQRSWLFLATGEPVAAVRELMSGIRNVIWRKYRCIQTIEMRYPGRWGDPAKTLEVGINDDEGILYCVRNCLTPGSRARVYVRYSSGRRKRIRLR